MSNFYQYQFISPDPLYAGVKEELNSYFDTGVVDDLMFPIWTEKALRPLGKGTLPIINTTLYLDDFAAVLPKGFDSVREAWLCTTIAPVTIRKPGAFYSQHITLLNPATDPCLPCDPCTPQSMELIYKATTDEIFTNHVSHLLTPGTLAAKTKCGQGCPNVFSQSVDTFDIRDGKFQTSFREGDVYLAYYGTDHDNSNYQLIPDNIFILNYLEAFLKYKVFEKLWNSITDETFNQIQAKCQIAKQDMLEAKVLAEIDIRKKTISQTAHAIKKTSTNLNKYIIR